MSKLYNRHTAAFTDLRSAHFGRRRILEKTVDEKLPPRVGVMGGTFDPIHDGHVAAALAAAAQHSLDIVILVPTFHNPLKKQPPTLTETVRLELLIEKIKDIPQLYFSSFELNKSPPYLTIDTLLRLKASNKKSQLFFILGLDNVTQMHHWKRMEEYRETVEFVPVGRNRLSLGDMLHLGPALHADLERNFVPLEIDLSSTEIRRALLLHAQ